MRNLTLNEINQVSGGEFFETLGAMAIGCIAGTASGILKAATIGGKSGGVLGAGIIGSLGGVVVGGVTGSIVGTMYGMVNSWEKTFEWFNKTIEQWFDIILPLPR